MTTTKIEWADATWSPVTGCTPISEGCQHCYAKRMAKRLAGRFGYPLHGGFEVSIHEDRLGVPARWKKPRRIFCVSMGDLFHDDAPHWFILKVIYEMRRVPRHTYMILTKRPERMRAFFEQYYPDGKPLPNLWLGVTAENQARADERIPILLQIPAEKRFVSIEPMLGRMGLGRHFPHIHGKRDDQFWVIIGQETGPGARSAKAEWFNSIIGQCRDAGVPVFVKKAPEGVEIIREFPA